MIDYENLKEFLNEQIDYERRQLKNISNINSPGAGMSIGAHDAYAYVLDFIEGRLDD